MTHFLPNGWNRRPIKYVATCNDDVLSENTNPEREISYVDIGNVQHGLGITRFEITTFSSAPSRARRLVRDGDVIASTVRTYLRAIARIDNPKEDVVVSTGFAVLRPGDPLASRFFGYAMQCEALIDEIVAQSTGVSYPAIAASDLIRLKIAFPDITTQNAIADFLDRETAEADALAAKYERLLELLEEKRVALITQAVTKGLDSNVRMKDSGVDWIGSIPEHWLTKRLWHFAPDDRQIMYGIVLPGPNVDEGVFIVKGGDVKPGRLNPSTLNRTTFAIEAGYKRSRLRGGDLVYAIRGGIGDVEIVPDSITGANITQDAARIALRPEVSPMWMRYVLESSPVFAQLQSAATGATIRGINIWNLKRAVIPTPPPEEQIAIASFLSAEVAQIELLCSQTEAAIALIKEHRSALITAAVTGQIDVTTYKSKSAKEAV